MLTALLTPGAAAFALADTLLTLSPWWALPVMAYMALVLYAAKQLL